MQISIFAILFIVAGTYASYQEKEAESRIITNQIRRVVNQIRNQIRQAGYDPYRIDDFQYENKPMPNMVEVEAFIDRLTFTGLSNIAINRLVFYILNPRLEFTFSLPELRMEIADSGVDVLVFGNKQSARLNGSLSIRNTRLTGTVWIYLILPSVRSISLNFQAGVFQSNLNMDVLGNDFSNNINTFFNSTVPEFLRQNAAEINRQLVQLAWDIIRGNRDFWSLYEIV